MRDEQSFQCVRRKNLQRTALRFTLAALVHHLPLAEVFPREELGLGEDLDPGVREWRNVVEDFYAKKRRKTNTASTAALHAKGNVVEKTTTAGGTGDASTRPLDFLEADRVGLAGCDVALCSSWTWRFYFRFRRSHQNHSWPRSY
ncbi:unnamed protein product [Amoebophrya sp. A120]|nr:unnamed protein product [Amoebophrya sp. A120]|eukprot:GSA120T00016494001.1